MRTSMVLLVALLAGCASMPEGPTLPLPISLTLQDYEESGGILPIVGTLQLTIDTEGNAKSVCHRTILTDIERRGSLTSEQRVELSERVETWSAKVKDHSIPQGSRNGLVYGTKQVAWQKDDTIDPDLQSLVVFLRSIPPTLAVLQHRR